MLIFIIAIHSMTDKYFANNDGEMLFVPYAGEIKLHTEFGQLELCPGMIAVIPRGVKFKVEVIGLKKLKVIFVKMEVTH